MTECHNLQLIDLKMMINSAKMIMGYRTNNVLTDDKTFCASY